MRKFKIVFVSVLWAAFLTMSSGCTTMSRLYSYTQENPVIVDLAVRQAVFRYIDAGATVQAKQDRAARVNEVVEQIEHFLEGNPTASAQTLWLIVKSNINMNTLTPADKLLVEDILTLVELNIERSSQEVILDEPVIIQVRVLLRTLIKTAALFYDPA